MRADIALQFFCKISAALLSANPSYTNCSTILPAKVKFRAAILSANLWCTNCATIFPLRWWNTELVLQYLLQYFFYNTFCRTNPWFLMQYFFQIWDMKYMRLVLPHCFVNFNFWIFLLQCLLIGACPIKEMYNLKKWVKMNDSEIFPVPLVYSNFPKIRHWVIAVCEFLICLFAFGEMSKSNFVHLYWHLYIHLYVLFEFSRVVLIDRGGAMIRSSKNNCEQLPGRQV